MTFALRRWLPLFIASALAVGGCDDSTLRLSEADDGSLKGELAVYIADEVGVGSETELLPARHAAGNERKLLFQSTQPEMVTGVRVSLRGLDSPEGFRVTDYRILPDDKPTQSALIDGTPYPPRSFAFVLINTGSGFTPVTYMGTRNTAVTADLIAKRMISDADSIRNYYLYDSYGRQDITDVRCSGRSTYTPNGCDTERDDQLVARDGRRAGRHLPALPLVLRQQQRLVQVGRSGVGRHRRRSPRRTTPGTTRPSAASCWCRSRGTTSACSTRRR